MKLSDLEKLGLAVLRNAEFKSLGLLSHKQDQMLVVLYDVSVIEELLANHAITCVVTSPALANRLPEKLGVGICPDPMVAFYRIHEYLLNQTSFYGAHFDTEISPTAKVASTAHISRKNVRIGARSVIESGAHILSGTIIGEDVVVRSGTVIGGEGFEPKMIGDRRIMVPHAGGVRLGSRVEILSNSHVAKSVFGDYTEVGADTKVDALVHIAHNVKIGAFCKIASGAVIAGSTSLGDHVWIGPGAIISSEVSIGPGVFVALGSVVIHDIQSGCRVFGVPARGMPAK